ncbi:MAG: hypothetical protein KGI97_01315 [Alphaproteobacteria bacterium]|nr:hypothetical protein [Alphaproteobacteria bacterium]
MPGFERDHYSLIELAERWKLPFKEIEHHTERNRLEVQLWMGDVVATRYVFTMTAGGEVVPAQQDVTTLKGYYIVDGDELRKMYRTPDVPEVKKLYSLDRKEFFTLHPACERFKVGIDALEVSRTERDRFEADHRIQHRLHEAKSKTRATSTLVGGRPSVMKVVVRHFKDRATQGRLKESANAESIYLEAWARKKLGADAPAAKTIANNIRPLFTAHKDTGSRA